MRRRGGGGCGRGTRIVPRRGSWLGLVPRDRGAFIEEGSWQSIALHSCGVFFLFLCIQHFAWLGRFSWLALGVGISRGFSVWHSEALFLGSPCFSGVDLGDLHFYISLGLSISDAHFPRVTIAKEKFYRNSHPFPFLLPCPNLAFHVVFRRLFFFGLGGVL